MFVETAEEPTRHPSPWRAKRGVEVGRARLIVAICCFVAVLTAQSSAVAQEITHWPFADASGTLVAFGESYQDGATTRTHQGLDIAGGAGEPVLACADGTVSFCGAVPTTSGTTILAVTITTAEGLKITCSPLESACVSNGDTLRSGEPIGRLAGQGDASSAEAHVHVSVRTGDTYVDPAGFLCSPPAPPVTSLPAPEIDPKPASVSSPASAAPDECHGSAQAAGSVSESQVAQEDGASDTASTPGPVVASSATQVVPEEAPMETIVTESPGAQAQAGPRINPALLRSEGGGRPAVSSCNPGIAHGPGYERARSSLRRSPFAGLWPESNGFFASVVVAVAAAVASVAAVRSRSAFGLSHRQE